MFARVCGRSASEEVLGHSWEVVDQEQRHEIVVAGDGVGGQTSRQIAP